jgi:Tfp pilus assembly protein PilF
MLANIYRDDRHDLKAAERLYREAIALKPLIGWYHSDLGLCLLRQKRRAEAMAEAKRALELGHYRVDDPLFKQLGLLS